MSYNKKNLNPIEITTKETDITKSILKAFNNNAYKKTIGVVAIENNSKAIREHNISNVKLSKTELKCTFAPDDCGSFIFDVKYCASECQNGVCLNLKLYDNKMKEVAIINIYPTEFTLCNDYTHIIKYSMMWVMFTDDFSKKGGM